VIAQLVVALELRRDLGEKRLVGMQPRDFVFVLVGHQFEQVARDGFGELAALQRRFR